MFNLSELNHLRSRSTLTDLFRRGYLRRRRRILATMEELEPRTMLSVVTVDASQTIRTVNTNILGTNVVDWDSNLSTPQTQAMIQSAGVSSFRFPVGDSDTFHFNQGPSWSTQPTAGSVATFIDAVGGSGIITVDYGSGSPQEAAAFMAYLDGSPTDNTSLGMGEQYDTTSNTWVQVNWQTVGYWAGLRAAQPLATDDGLNFLRMGQSASFGIQFFEVGSQEYQSWNTDYHGSGGDPGAAHDPTTYANFVIQFAALAKEINPSALIGIDSSGPSGDWSNWLGSVLTVFNSASYTPGFISDEVFLQNPGTESDTFLLNQTMTDTSQSGGDPTDWVQRAADYEDDLTTYLGATNGAKVELINTNISSVSYNPGKQSVSLVSGLWLADSLGAVLSTPWDGVYYSAMRAYISSGNDDSSSLYGWRQDGDLGMIGISGSAPESGPYVAYPTYFAEALASKLVQPNGTLVDSSSDDSLLDAYAVLEPNGHLDIMVINKDPNNNLNEQFDLQGFTPSGQTEVWQYGEAEDTAQSLTSDGSSSLTVSSPNVSVSGNNFSFMFPEYSMTVIDLAPAGLSAPTATVTVDAAQTVRAAETQDLGVNIAQWDWALSTPQTAQMVLAAGLTSFRFPGGSASDSFHFNVGAAWSGEGTSASMASFIASIGGTGVVTLNYGTGSPQEAAAFLAYLNGSASDNTVIGMGEEWDTTSSTWVQTNWQTVGYWASLRGSTPLATDDGYNFLRVDHPTSFGIHYFEVGNEVYGSWETDEHGSGGDTGAAHDPATYTNFVMQFATFANEIDPTISIGFDSPGPGSGDYNNWLADVLTIFADHDFTPGFLSDHSYLQVGGTENDAFLLNDTVTDTTQSGGDPSDWVQRSADFENVLTAYLGATNAAKVQLLETELNSSGTPGKQMSSLVNGLWLADSIGAMMQTAFDGSFIWDLRNGFSTSGNDSSSLYGWRDGGDFGLLGTTGTAPQSGTYIAYPTYFAEELASKFDQVGGTVVGAVSGDALVDTFAVMEANGHLDLMIINKDPNFAHTDEFDLQGFAPGAQAQVYQYGEAQDTAQSETADGSASLANFTTNLTLSGNNFDYSFPAYSMTVIDLTPSGQVPTPPPPPPSNGPVTASPNPVNARSVNLSAQFNGNDSALTYTWAILSAPLGVATPTFSNWGSNAAKNTTVTLYGAGVYVFQANTKDSAGNFTVLGNVTVTVNQTITTIKIAPTSATIALNTTRQMTAVAYDQFGAAMKTPPTFNWTIAGGAGQVSSGGLFTAPASNGSTIVEAAAGSTESTVTVNASDLAPSKLAIVQESEVGITNAPLMPAIVVAVEDAAGSVVAGDNSGVTLQLAMGPAGGALTGIVTVAAFNGLAVFNDVALTQPGNYNLAATDGSFTGATTTTIQIFAGAVRRFLMNGVPSSRPSVAFEEQRALLGTTPVAAQALAVASQALGGMNFSISYALPIVSAFSVGPILPDFGAADADAAANQPNSVGVEDAITRDQLLTDPNAPNPADEVKAVLAGK